MALKLLDILSKCVMIPRSRVALGFIRQAWPTTRPQKPALNGLEDRVEPMPFPSGWRLIVFNQHPLGAFQSIDMAGVI